jgi:hypothetical protein
MRLVHFGALLLAIPACAQNPPAWVARSNQNTQLLIDIEARYAPEDAAAEGVKGLDEQIITFAAGIQERKRAPNFAKPGRNWRAASPKSRTRWLNRISKF